jgi:hypothetical protein
MRSYSKRKLITIVGGTLAKSPSKESTQIFGKFENVFGCQLEEYLGD